MKHRKERTIQEIKDEIQGLMNLKLENKISVQTYEYLLAAAKRELKGLIG